MPQAAQQDYLRLPIAAPTALTADELAKIERYIRDGIILDVVVETGSGKKNAKVQTYDLTSTPVIKTSENTIVCIRALSAAIDNVTANVGETLTGGASVAENDVVSVTFSDKLPVGTYAGVIKTTTESISVNFSVSTNPNATVSYTCNSTNANKLKNAKIESITLTILSQSVAAVFAVEA